MTLEKEPFSCDLLILSTGKFCPAPAHHSFYAKGDRHLTWICCPHFDKTFGLASHSGACNTEETS